MTLKEYLDSLPNTRTETIEKLRELTCVSKVTMWRWRNGGQVPPLAQKVIADFIGKPADELFPAEKMVAL